MEGIDYKAMYEALVAQKGPATKGKTFAARWNKQDGCDAYLFLEAIKLGYTAQQVSPFPKDKIGFMVPCGCNTKKGNKTNRCKRHMDGNNKWELDRPWNQVEMFRDEGKSVPYYIMNDTDGNVTEPKDIPQPARPQQRATAARGKGDAAKLKEALARIVELENQVRRLSMVQPDLDDLDEPVGETTSAETPPLPFESDQEEPPPSPTSSASSIASAKSEGKKVKKVYTRKECLKKIKKYENSEEEGAEKKVETWNRRLDRVI